MDKAQSVKEKYGGYRGWKMSLRYDEENKDSALEYRESLGAMENGLSYKIIDERKKPIEIIRKNVPPIH